MINVKLLTALLSSALLSTSALAEGETSTLQKIKQTGTITLGHRESSIPFSYYDQQQNVIGYSHELMMKVVNSLKSDLGLSVLTIKMFPITPLNRLSLMQNGTIDLECGSTTNNSERQKQVAFSNTIFIATTRLLTKKTYGIKDFPDLAGKKVVTSVGTTSERLLHKMNADKNMKMTIVSVKDHAEAVLTVKTGQAVAYMMDDALLYGQRAKARNPEEWVIVGQPQSFEPYGCMMRKGDVEFKKAVDNALAKIMKSDEIEKIYNKWFMKPIPPEGLTLDFPMGKETRDAFKNPNDKAFD
ncbi:MAG TPA: glutamate/aspartate ABC transporter substrate-binding protein [Burkholderiales bacterium]|nr:glutamate/aspartate ABC transporter substrate-binding protein [Burkholderiales bacterium]